MEEDTTINFFKSQSMEGLDKRFRWHMDRYFFILKVGNLFQCVVEAAQPVQEICDFTNIVSGGTKSI